MIRIDPRAGSGSGAGTHGRFLARHLRRLGAETKLVRFGAGDVWFWGQGPDGPVKVGVELKTLSDLLSSLDSGRLVAKQLPPLCQTYPYRYLLILGAFRPARDGSGVLVVPQKGGREQEAGWGRRRWTYVGLIRALNSLCAQAGVCWIRTWSLMETAWAIFALYDWWTDEWESHSTLKAFHHRPPSRAQFSRPSLMRTLIADIPELGWEYSYAAEERFGSVAAAARAGAKEWASLRRDGVTRDGRRRPCVGMKRAKRIVAMLRGE